MADPLSLLRHFFMANKSLANVVEKNDMYCFGEYCWPKHVKTNYLIYSSSRDGPNKSYYNLECLVYFLKNVHLQHPTYVKQAASFEIPVVQRPDRKDLLQYLSGETQSSPSIDKSAPIELPISISQLKDATPANASNSNSAPSNDNDGPTAAKLARMDEVRKQFAARLDAPKIKKTVTIAPEAVASQAGQGGAGGTSLLDSMSHEQIAALKAKRWAKKRSTINDPKTDLNDVTDVEVNNQTSVHLDLLQYDLDITKEILKKERIWRNRSSILQTGGMNFQKTIFPMLLTIKAREDGRSKGGPPGVPGALAPRNSVPNPSSNSVPGGPNHPALPSSQQYNRYDQERFSKSDSVIGFSIDTTSTYHGLTLKSVTEGGQPGAPVKSGGDRPSPLANGANVVQKPTKRVSRTPIIIIPATNTSLITMYNAKAILQDLKFVDSKQCDQRRENEILIQRRKPDNTTVPYRIIDNPVKLSSDDWNRVVAVFVQGPAWQFKGWPWNGNPVEIFARIKAFHLKFDEMKLDSNVAKWSVEIIELSRSKRHLDRANLLKFWSQLDQHIQKHKHNVVRY